nr:hypothetical protein CFP56_21179 [Quercus suber]
MKLTSRCVRFSRHHFPNVAEESLTARRKLDASMCKVQYNQGVQLASPRRSSFRLPKEEDGVPQSRARDQKLYSGLPHRAKLPAAPPLQPHATLHELKTAQDRLRSCTEKISMVRHACHLATLAGDSTTRQWVAPNASTARQCPVKTVRSYAGIAICAAPGTWDPASIDVASPALRPHCTVQEVPIMMHRRTSASSA